MHISDIAIRRPVFTSMVALGLMVLGFFEFFTLGVDLFPDVNFPVVTITTVYPGAGPKEVETLVSRPLEDALASINRLDKLSSTSREGVSIVLVTFDLEANGEMAAIEVRDKVARVRGQLPKEIRDPVVSRVDLSAVPLISQDLPLEARVEVALDRRADVQAARAQLRVAQAAVLDSHLDFLPTISLQGSYRWSNAAGFTGENATWAAGAAASLPVWDGGLRFANIKDAKEKRFQAEESFRKLEMQVRKEVEIAGDNVSQARVSLRITEEELRLARRTYDQLLALYQAGRATSLELRDTELLVSNAELGKLRAALDLDLAILSQKRAAGERLFP